MKKKACIIMISNEKIQQEVDLEIKNRKLNYHENDGTNVFFDLNERVLVRENDQFFMELFFEKNIISVYLKEDRKTLEIPIITHQIVVNDDKIKITYQLEEQDYCYEIRMEDAS